jgi:hypothetical protein
MQEPMLPWAVILVAMLFTVLALLDGSPLFWLFAVFCWIGAYLGRPRR